MFHRKDKEDVYAEVVGDLYDNKIISEKTFDKITGWDNEKDKEKDDYLEIKVNGIDKYDSFEMFASGPGKLIESKLYYGINSKYYPITFFNAIIKTTSYSSISSTTIISKCMQLVVKH